MTTTTQPMTVDRATQLAADLVRALTPLSGDRAAVNAELRNWLDVPAAGDLSLVCIAAVQLIFAECLTPTTPLDQLPPDRLALILPTERNSA